MKNQVNPLNQDFHLQSGCYDVSNRLEKVPNVTCMRQLITTSDYYVSIDLAKKMDDGIKYKMPVIYHCYWKGTLNEKHYYSIKSCYYFNVYKNKNNKIILWLEGNVINEYYNKIKEYAEIRYFSFSDEKENTGFIADNFYYNKLLSYYSDVVRYLLFFIL